MKRTIILLSALAVLLTFSACGGNNVPETKGDPATGGQNTAETADAADEQEKILEEMDITELVESWRGQGDDGKVTTPGTFESTVIKSLADLAPYRPYFPALSDLDAARITSDADGLALVLEIASPDTNLVYGVDSVTREGTELVFLVSCAPEQVDEELAVDEYGNEIERPAPGAAHEYFLFYIPAAEYHDEVPVFPFAG